MLYFKVKPEYDNKYYTANYTTPRGTKIVRCGMLIGDELENRGFTKELTVCKHNGVLFGDNTCFDDGRFYQWWYSDDSDILLRVYFSSNTTERIPLYFSELIHTKESVIRLIRSFDAE